MIIFFCLTLHTALVSGSSLSDKVYQNPPDMLIEPGKAAKIHCSHSIDNYNRILWYKQSKNGHMQYLGYMNVNTGYPEDEVKVKIEGKADKGQTCTLTTEVVTLNGSAVYFCAARDRGTYPPEFGEGTRLTVLEAGINVTSPTVKILQPAKEECLSNRDKQDEKKKKKKKTLLCVASKFYPDHVSVSWQIDGEDINLGVATDEAAVQGKDKFYRITSRLRVSSDVWFTRNKAFTCIVSFYNGKTTEEVTYTLFNNEAGKRDKYVMITKTAKYSYTIFIIKSCIYGVFIVFLVWKLQGSTGKQN